MKNIAVVILAAGKGERMKSALPKVLHPVCGRPLLGYVLDLVKGLKPERAVAVLGYGQEEVRTVLPRGIDVVIQDPPRGTGDAVRCALPKLAGFKGTVLVLYGDNPLLTKGTLRNLLERHVRTRPAATLLTATLEKPAGYGRIIRDAYASIAGIVEEKDANDFQKQLKEINTGIICFDKQRLADALGAIRPNNRKKEYYLTDAVKLLYQKGAQIDSLRLADLNEALGINSRQELAQASKIMQRRISESLMKAGVSIIDPETTFICYGAAVGCDTVIYPFTVIERGVKIGKRCSIGPFAHLREGTVLTDDVFLGNFIEVVRSRLSAKTFAKHFCYIGDSRIGRQVNIGAGTVTANFDGKNKHTTVIKDKAFIGSDTVLVAPATVGRAAATGAGAVVVGGTRIPDGAVVVGVPARRLKKK